MESNFERELMSIRHNEESAKWRKAINKLSDDDLCNKDFKRQEEWEDEKYLLENFVDDCVFHEDPCATPKSLPPKNFMEFVYRKTDRYINHGLLVPKKLADHLFQLAEYIGGNSKVELEQYLSGNIAKTEIEQ